MRNMILSTTITATTVLGVTGFLLQSSAPPEKTIVSLPVEEYMEEKGTEVS